MNCLNYSSASANTLNSSQFIDQINVSLAKSRSESMTRYSRGRQYANRTQKSFILFVIFLMKADI